jgi:glutamyl-tRNA synthetase
MPRFPKPLHSPLRFASVEMTRYRGRIAPSPTGYLHIGHAMTFCRAQERARATGGSLILRIEDLDLARCRSEFRDAIIADLKWFGLEWDEGPDRAGLFAPYVQSERRAIYLDAWEKLRAGGFIYPCQCSRKDVFEAAVAPHDDESEEPVYPGTCRPVDVEAAVSAAIFPESRVARPPLQPGPAGIHWRFRVPDGEEMRYVDLRLGEQCAIAGKDFGDFIVWRKDDVPAYQLAVVVDDAAMKISEVVRGEDLLTSTFRQLLIYRALNLQAPKFYHAPLIVDESGRRLAKRHASLSLRALREAEAKPEDIRKSYFL